MHYFWCRFLPSFRNLFNPMNLSQGGENALKKVSLAGPVLHPFLAYVLTVTSFCLIYQRKLEELNWLLCNLCSCSRSYMDVLKTFFEDRLLLSQQLFSSEERCQKILDLISDESKKRHHEKWTLLSDILPQFQIIRRFGFFRYIAFAMYVDKCISKCIAKTMYLEKPKHLIIWNGGSRWSTVPCLACHRSVHHHSELGLISRCC